MKKSLTLLVGVFLTLNIYAFDTDCEQLHTDVHQSMMNMGFTGAEAYAIADAAYLACMNTNGQQQ